MDFVQLDPAELPLISLLIVTAGLIGWRFLGVLDGGIRYIADALKDFTHVVRVGNQIDEKQTAIIEKLDQRIKSQGHLIQQTQQQIDDFASMEKTEFQLLSNRIDAAAQDAQDRLIEQFHIVTANLQAIETNLDDLPDTLKRSVHQLIQDSMQNLVMRVEAILMEGLRERT